jgi:hypothetical protein
VVAFLTGAPSTPTEATTPHVHVSPNGREQATCTCRPATPEERLDLSLSPDGWVQDEPRASFNRGTVPYSLVPDWVAGRVRACGGLAWGDADRDGDMDLAVGTYFANMWPPIVDYYNYIYLNNGGTFSEPPGWISPDQKHTAAVFWADLNGDTHPDLFCGNGGSSFHPSQVFYGQNGLLPTTPGWQSASVAWLTDAAPADFDLDNDVDVATANEGNSADPYRPTYLFRNLGNGLETYPSWASAQVGITDACDWGDMDGDGRPELAVTGWVNWQTGVFRNLGTTLDPNFAWTTGHPERTDKGIGWSDVDGDHHLDLCVGGNGGPDWLYRNEGTMLGALPVWSSGESYHGCQELLWEDVDRDGDEDLVTAHFSTGHVRIYLNEAGVLPSVADWQYDDASSATAIAFGDLDGDHLPDLAVGVANGPVKVFLNTGTAEGAPETAADLPRDGLRLTAGPNPCHDRAILRLESTRTLASISIDVFDVTGRVVASLHRGIRPSAGCGFGEDSGGSSPVRPVGAPRGVSRWIWTPSDGADAGAGVFFVRVIATDDEVGGRWTTTTRIVRLRS